MQYYLIISIANKLFYIEASKLLPVQIIINAIFAVDSFFVLSGILAAYLFLHQSSQKQIDGFFISKYFLHRYLRCLLIYLLFSFHINIYFSQNTNRLTPTYVIVIIIGALFSPFFGSGPFYPNHGLENDRCSSWW